MTDDYCRVVTYFSCKRCRTVHEQSGDHSTEVPEGWAVIDVRFIGYAERLSHEDVVCNDCGKLINEALYGNATEACERGA